jgi:putative spermidine/putrescine transport system ATP-binding protein
MTVRENIGYGLSPLPKAERKERVDELLALVRLESFADRLPRQLSGGQQQRVAVARAIAPRPSLLLLDEPFAALDRALRADMQFEFVRLQRNLGITAILVTHDQEEAQAVADDLIVMNAGKVEQIGSPAQVYDHPQSLFVNGFVGQASVLRATVEGSEGGGTIIRLGTGDRLVLPSSPGYPPGSRVVVAIRPEHVRLESGAAEGAIGAIRTLSVPQGHLVLHDLLLSDGSSLKAIEQRVVGSSDIRAPQDVFVSLDRDRCRLFQAP